MSVIYPGISNYRDLESRIRTYKLRNPVSEEDDTPKEISIPIGTERPPLFLEAVAEVRQESSLGESNLFKALQIITCIRAMGGAEELYYLQQSLLNIALSRFLHLIVGKEENERNRSKYMQILGVTGVSPITYIIMPRQSGKTALVAMLLCVLLCVCPGGKFVCIAVSMNQSVEILDRVKSFYTQLPDKFKLKIITSNKENLKVEHTPGVHTQLVCRSQVPNAVRGIDPDGMFLDEFEFISYKFYMSVIYPLYQLSHRVMLTISTPGAPEGKMSDMRREAQERQAIGDNFRHVYDYSMICQKCRDADVADICAHGLYMLPPWKSISAIISLSHACSDADRANFIQEVYGESLTPPNRLFSEKVCTKTFTHNNTCQLLPDQLRNVIYCAVDPSGGGDSNAALITFIRDRNGQIMIIGLENVNMRNLAIEKMSILISAHMEKILRLHPMFATARIIPILEHAINTAVSFSNYFQRACRGHVVSPYHDPGGKFMGYHASDPNHSASALIMHTFLVVSPQIRISPTLISVGARSWNSAARAISADTVLSQLCTQMKTVSRDPIKGKISGKIGSHTQDDMAMAILMGIHAMALDLGLDD